MTLTHRNWIIFAILFALFSTAIVLRAVLFHHGGLSHDSMYYLGQARAFSDTGTLYMLDGGSITAGKEYFSVWPWGYPLLIGVTTSLTSLPVYWSGKLVNIILAFITMITIYRTFKPTGYVYAMFMFSASVMAIFTYIWSEALLVCIMTIGASKLSQAHADRSGAHVKYIVYLVALSCAAFLARYIGLFFVGTLGYLFLLYIYRKQFRASISCLLGIAVVLIFVATYLAINYHLTGLTTGMPRIPAPESAIELLRQTSTALLGEFIFPVREFSVGAISHLAVVGIQILLVAGLVAALVSRPRSDNQEPIFSDSRFVAFSVVGGGYLCAAVAMRWLYQFDPIHFRLVAPGFLLIGIAGLRFLELKARFFTSLVAGVMATLAALSLIVSTYEIFASDKGGYYDRIAQINLAYEAVPSGSIVLFGELDLKYLRPDLHVAYPRFKPYYKDDQTMDDFLESRDWSRQVFLEVSDRALTTPYHSSVSAYLSEFSPGDLVQLRRPGMGVE